MIGKVTTGVASPQLSVEIGYVKCFKNANFANKKMILKDHVGEESECVIFDLPF